MHRARALAGMERDYPDRHTWPGALAGVVYARRPVAARRWWYGPSARRVTPANRRCRGRTEAEVTTTEQALAAHALSSPGWTSSVTTSVSGRVTERRPLAV